MTPKCCQKCDYLMGDSNCRNQGKRCLAWRCWFDKEWAKIRQAANIKKKGAH